MTSPSTWASWGPQFTFQSAGDVHDVAGWIRLDSLPEDAPALRARVDQTAEALSVMSGGAALPDERVAASLSQMALVGRIVAVSVGLAVHGFDASGVLRGDVLWRPEPGVGFPVALPRPGVASEPLTLQDSWVERLTDAVAERFGVSTHVVWGNVASTVQATMRTVARVSPDHAASARRVCAKLIAHPTIPEAEKMLEGEFRRMSCCLLYRVAPDGAPVCGDCVRGRRA